MPLVYIFCPWILQRGAVVILRRAWADGVAGTGDIPTIEFGYFEAPRSDQPLFALLLLPQGGFSPEVNIIISGNCRVLLESLSRLILIWLGAKHEKKKKKNLHGGLARQCSGVVYKTSQCDTDSYSAEKTGVSLSGGVPMVESIQP